MKNNFKILVAPPNENNRALITVNETLLYRNDDYMVNAFQKQHRDEIKPGRIQTLFLLLAQVW